VNEEGGCLPPAFGSPREFLGQDEKAGGCGDPAGALGAQADQRKAQGWRRSWWRSPRACRPSV